MTRPRTLVIAGLVLAALAAVLVVVLLAGGGQRQGAKPSTTPPASPPAQTEGGFAGVNGTLRVEPSAIAVGHKARVVYSITNRSGHDVHAATTDISIVVGQNLTSTNIVIGSVDKDIPAGRTVQGSLTSDLAGVDLGRQNVM